MGLSTDLEDSSGDADVLGAIGDTYTDLGDLEKAAEVWHCQLYMQVRKCSRTTLVLQAWAGALVHMLGALMGSLGPCNYAAVSWAVLVTRAIILEQSLLAPLVYYFMYLHRKASGDYSFIPHSASCQPDTAWLGL